MTDHAGSPEDPTTDDPPSESSADHDARRAAELRQLVLRKSIRRERAQRRRDENIWSWLATFGLIGWTVVVPIVLGLALGRFLDQRFDGPVSFTLTLLVVGVAAGLSMAWHWIRTEGHHHG